jgi:hypothetical protein
LCCSRDLPRPTGSVQEPFKDPGEELRLEIVGRDPFNGALDRVLAGRTVAQRRVVVTHVVTPTVSPLPHVRFISSDQEERLTTLLGRYCRKPVLTISDVDRFANRGGAIGLVEGGIFDLWSTPSIIGSIDSGSPPSRVPPRRVNERLATWRLMRSGRHAELVELNENIDLALAGGRADHRRAYETARRVASLH